MNPQATISLGNDHQQELRRAAAAARLAGEIQHSRWTWRFARRRSAFRLGFGSSAPRPSLDSPAKV